MHRFLIGAALLALALGPPAAAQDAGKEDVGKLREELDRLRRRVDEIEQKRAAPAATTSTADDEELRALREDAAKQAAGGAPSTSTSGGGGIQQRLNQFNPRITAFGDFVGRLQTEEHPFESGGREIDNHFSLREVELDLRADIDPYAKAVLILSVSKEHPADSYGIDVEEGYATLETLPWNFRAKIGRWRQEFGTANNTHRHDLPWFDYPYAIQQFFGPDGLDAEGIGLLWLWPKLNHNEAIPDWLTDALNLGTGLQVQANVIESTQDPLFTPDAREPAYLGRASYFLDLTDHAWIQLGGSALFGKTTPGGGGDALLAGADATFKYVQSQYTSFVLTAELYELLRRDRVDPATQLEHHDRAHGFFVAAQLQPGFLNQLTGTSWERWYVGARYDWDDYFAQQEGDREWAASFFVSYYTTEFLRLRLGFEHREIRVGDRGGPEDLNTILLQVTWVFGSHPAEPYWVNK